MADDLDDEWWLEDKKHNESSENQENDKKKAKKRKNSQRSERHVKGRDEDVDDENTKKKKKRKRRPKTEDITKELHGKSILNALWDTFSKSCSSKLTPLELDDLKIDDSCCLTEDSIHTGDVSELPSYLEKVIPYWKEQVEKMNKKKTTGSPLLLFVTSAATRAVELNKVLEKFKGDAKTVKLFAKHFKIEEQIKFLDSHVVHLGIGTPNRILKLLSNDSLKTSKTKYVIIDWTWRDQKLRSIADMPEVKEDLNHLLQKFVFPLAKSGKIKVGLF
ncbi:protein CMSS1-like [Actinia tenebrosa]|uniref:Protein CMSS1-like n=1 Tax=Actinia tenebrosa TaxID=6105 RepID=A0A6P8I202_ACTTE|nr:protein CMSS1-like [Actinia tenebrosa]